MTTLLIILINLVTLILKTVYGAVVFIYQTLDPVVKFIYKHKIAFVVLTALYIFITFR